MRSLRRELLRGKDVLQWRHVEFRQIIVEHVIHQHRLFVVHPAAAVCLVLYRRPLHGKKVPMSFGAYSSRYEDHRTILQHLSLNSIAQQYK